MKKKIITVQKFVLIVVILFLFLSACNQNKTIPIKVALVYKMGAQPVARVKFYLLKEDLKVINDQEGKIAYTSPSTASLFASLSDLSIKAGIHEEDIKEFIVATTTTDFEGNAKFENISKGVYYIAGFTTTRSKSGYVVWSVKLDTDNIKETLLLDQNNALAAEEY